MSFTLWTCFCNWLSGFVEVEDMISNRLQNLAVPWRYPQLNGCLVPYPIVGTSSAKQVGIMSVPLW